MDLLSSISLQISVCVLPFTTDQKETSSGSCLLQPSNTTLKFVEVRLWILEVISSIHEKQELIKLGTYFSLPEWYNPAYAEYAITWGGGFPGGPPVNPYTNETITYTGYVSVNDFITDIQLPQMRQLAYQYETELMWCDIGGANNSTIFASEWLNWARDQGRQVTFNNRCGIPGDFDTPE